MTTVFASVVLAMAAGCLAEAQGQTAGERAAQRARAQALEARNQFAEAEKMLRALVESDPGDGESWFDLGELLYRNGYYGGALPALEKSLEIQKGNLKAAIYRAVSLAKLGEAQRAEAAFRELGRSPAALKDPDFLIVYADLLYQTGRLEAALERADQAARELPNSGIAHFWRARILLRLGRLEEAAREAERAVELQPQLPFARNLLIQIYRREGRTADAERQALWLREREDRSIRDQRP